MLKCLSQHKKKISQLTCLDLSHYSAIFCRDIVFFFHNKDLLPSSVLYVATELLMLRKSSTAICFDQCPDRVRNVATFFFKNFSSNVATYKSFVATKFCLMISFMSQHSLLYRNIYQSISLILCRNRVVRCRENIHF